MLHDTSAAVALIAQASTLDLLGSTFDGLTNALGMSASASGMVSGPRALGANRFHFTNWPATWQKLYQARNFATIDPLPRWAIVSGEAASWTQIVGTLDRHDPGHAVYRAAGEHGFFEGFATPVRTRDGSLGLVTVGGGRRTAFSPDDRLHLQSISIAALNRAETILQPSTPPPFLLTKREKECVTLLQQGFSDPEISRTLAISPATVRFHMENARKKTGARNRVDLAVRAGSLAM